jgi:hypothetical protein
MAKVVIVIDEDVEKRLYASHRRSIDGVTLRQRVRAYKRFLQKHYDNQMMFTLVDEIRPGLRRILHDRLDGMYLVEQVSTKVWWKFWSSETKTHVQIIFLELTYHPGSSQ